MAGTYLGKDPLNPQIVPHTPNLPAQGSSATLQVSPQALLQFDQEA